MVAGARMLIGALRPRRVQLNLLRPRCFGVQSLES